MSGSATSLSASTTLTQPPSPELKAAPDPTSVFHNPQFSASDIVEYLSSRPQSTSTVYVYELAEQAGFGILTQQWATLEKDGAKVVRLQSRDGAGLSIVGRLSAGTSRGAAKGAQLTAYTTPNGLSMMAASFIHLPPAASSSRLVVHVPTVTSIGDNFTLSPTIAPLATIMPVMPEDMVILLSATPQETVDFTAVSYQLHRSHVIHLFDHYSSAREVGSQLRAPPNLERTLGTVHEILDRAGHESFEYVGGAEPQVVFAMLNGPLALAAKAVARRIPGLAIVTVKVLRPWNEDALRKALPSSLSTMLVLDEVMNPSSHGILYGDVMSSVADLPSRPSVHSVRVTPTQVQEYLLKPDTYVRLLTKSIKPDPPVPSLLPPLAKKLLLLSDPRSTLSALPKVIQGMFLASQRSISSRLLMGHDVFSKPGGVAIGRLLLSPAGDSKDSLPLPVAIPIDSSTEGAVDFLAVLDQTLLSSHSIVKYAKPKSSILVITSWSLEELAANIPHEAISVILQRDLRVFAINSNDIGLKFTGADGPAHSAVQNFVALLAFVRLYLGAAATQDLVNKVVKNAFGEVVEGLSINDVSAEVWSGLHQVHTFPPLSPEIPDSSSSLRDLNFNAIAVEVGGGETVVNGARLGSWHDAAKHLLFPSVYAPEHEETEEEYPQDPSLRPEVPDRTYLVTCTVNRRLTPREYDRNVFHLEFDTQGTGLKYEIGEALGVHGWNDEAEILEFCDWYGADPKLLITIPVTGSEGEEGKSHTRTVIQALQQQIDIFGRPPKSFYTDLAEYTTNSVDRHALLFIGSAEGLSTFKKLSEKDTVNFVDILQMFPSARPSIETLCIMVGDIKPRHYSIASAQSVVGDRVDLLIVTVDWITPSGSPRFGQCTRYLAGLEIGQKVTVSIKPSVMKLPPDDMQPLILAGLGTGAAPFRAFLQHRALLKSLGKPIGPVYYYFGSRHQSQEYLYGEEIEAFILDNVITRAGLAFSRDGPKKVYIQHKMSEDAGLLVKMLQDDEGVFYLCGPTWPVPDVYEALVHALVTFKGMDLVAAGDYLEGLKEEERYVLEVY